MTEELKLLRYLNGRMHLPSKDYSHYLNLEKGYSGKKQFDKLLADLPDEWIIINDLLLEISHTIFQLDSLIITGDYLHVFEVKNFEGNFFIEQDRWYTASKTEVKNPLLQLQRSESLLRRLLQELGFKLPIISHLIFVNSEFYLYQAPLNLPAIFPAQINRIMDNLKNKPIAPNRRQMTLAEILISLNLKETSYGRIPEYTFEELEKGIKCVVCQHFMKQLHKTALICKKCGYKEGIELAILRSVEEFRVMFPDMMITTNNIHDWCKVLDSKKTIRRILSNNFKHITHGKSSYFLIKTIDDD